MSEWLKRLWHDPVWSKVIAAGIIFVIASTSTYFWAHPAVRAHLLLTIGAPVAVPRVLLGLILALAAVPLARWCHSWWQRMKPRKIVVEFVPPPAPPPAPPRPPVAALDLDEKQHKLLTMLWHVYDKSITLFLLQPQFDMTYGAMERLVESVEAHGLVEIIPGIDQRKSVVLTKKGRDFVHESGLDLLA